MKWPRRARKGQATTEVVLLFPIFMFILFAFAKVFAMLILIQKIEIASFYAGRRWQLESHRNANCEGWDQGTLLLNIQDKVCQYLGYGSGCTTPTKNNFLDLSRSCPVTKECTAGAPGVTVQRTQVWNVVTVTVCTNPINLPYFGNKGYVHCRTKYVPNRDRPIAFILPGLQEGAAPKDKGCSGG